MENNKLIIRINKPIQEVFAFAITPPNSALWIPSVDKEETNEWPIRIGTIYKLQNNKGELSEVIVVNLRENEIVEWISKDKNYHCRYTFKIIDNNISELEYAEWVDEGQIDKPFTLEVLEKLKFVLEK